LSNRKASYKIQNTSEKVLARDLCITGTKTGWTDEAGYNLVTQAKDGGKELIAIVMGSKISRNYEEVYQLLKKYQ
jgi:D-alanyl-D-alanine carboxypeptidase